MDRLRKSDPRLLLAFVGDCYQLRTFEDFAPHIVHALSALVPADHTYNEMDLHNRKSQNFVNTPELTTSAAARLWEQHMHEQLMESLSEAFQETADRLAQVGEQSQPETAWKAIVKAYLSPELCDHVEYGCPLTALAPELDEPIRR